MQIFRVFAAFVVVVSLLLAAGGAFAKNCSCHHTTTEMKMDCHKQMAKQEKKEKCCCDKAMGCKVSFNLLGGGDPLAFLSSPASYYLSQSYAHSLHLVPAAQPPKV